MVGNASSVGLLQAQFNNSATSLAQATVYVGLITVSNGAWAASTAYTAGETIYVQVGGITYIMKCTTAGTSGSAAPTWDVTEGATTTDGTGGLVWTEQTIAIRGGTFTEASGGGYERIAMTSDTTNFTVSTDANNRGSVVNIVDVTGWAPTADWGMCVGAIYMTAATAGSLLEWLTFTTPISVVANSTPKLPANGDSLAIG